jgi:ABC-type glycerol-3-phosphate transport system substrate-binding protein
MRSHRMRWLALLTVVAATSASLVLTVTTASGNVRSKTTLQVWLGGILTTSTPGTPFRKWVDAQTKLFKRRNPGVNVQITLLPADNGQLAAKVEAAFTAHSVPDVMMLYAGAYTTAYDPGLTQLNSYVNSTPGFYKSFVPSTWNFACRDFNCENGKGYIMGVPFDLGGFVMFYNKALFKKAGLTHPASTYTGLYKQCGVMKSKGILPIIYGDRDGYATSNMLTSDLVSYFHPGDLQKLLARKIKFNSSDFLSSLHAITGLKSHGCVNSDASSFGQLNSDNKFAAGGAAMVEGQPQNLPQFVGALGKNVGVWPMPVSGKGPWAKKQAGNAIDNWVIPKGAKNSALAWKWIRLATSKSMQLLEVPDLGSPPATLAAAKSVKDPYVRYFAHLTAQAEIPELDQAVPNQVALVFYRYLNQAFSGASSSSSAMSHVDQTMAQARH